MAQLEVIKYNVLFDTKSSKDLIAPQFAIALQCNLIPIQLEVNNFTQASILIVSGKPNELNLRFNKYRLNGHFGNTFDKV